MLQPRQKAVNKWKQQSLHLKTNQTSDIIRNDHGALPFHLTSNLFSFNLPTKWISDAVWAVGAESQTSTWPSTAIWLQEDTEQAEPDQAGQQPWQSSSGAKWTQPG